MSPVIMEKIMVTKGPVKRTALELTKSVSQMTIAKKLMSLNH